MFRSASKRSSGFTLLEALVASLVFGILMASLYAFFRGSRRAYNLQEEISDRNQNAQFVLKRISEILMQAGANLPAQGWPVITPPFSVSDRFQISSNPGSGAYFVRSDNPKNVKVPVDDEKGFRRATGILVEFKDKSKGIAGYDIDQSYNSNGFVNGIKAVDSGPDTLYLAASLLLVSGDVLYAHSRDEYRIENQELLKNSMVLAQGIDSLMVTFFNQAMVPTQVWNDMKSARISVTARTKTREPDLGGDGYRRITLSTDMRLRNRI